MSVRVDDIRALRDLALQLDTASPGGDPVAGMLYTIVCARNAGPRAVDSLQRHMNEWLRANIDGDHAKATQ